MAARGGSTSWRRFSSALFASIFLAPEAGFACPVCRSEVGEQVRAGILDENFRFHLLASALPFPIFLVIVAALHGTPKRRRSTVGERDAGMDTGSAEGSSWQER
jgi:hypothetical protein